MHFVQVYDFRTYTGSEAFNKLNATNQMHMFDNLIGMGIPSFKIVYGIQFLGHKFKHDKSGIKFEVTMGSSHACETFKKLRVAYILMKSKTVTHHTIELETIDTIGRKIEFVKSRNLAGVAIFPINTDDFLEKCGENIAKNAFADYHIPNPLLRIVNMAIGNQR